MGSARTAESMHASSSLARSELGAWHAEPRVSVFLRRIS